MTIQQKRVSPRTTPTELLFWIILWIAFMVVALALLTGCTGFPIMLGGTPSGPADHGPTELACTDELQPTTPLRGGDSISPPTPLIGERRGWGGGGRSKGHTAPGPIRHGE